ncbi:SAM-dependent methyltransferase [Streptomyces sp. NPDC059567]|uniref:SAM-dependent methyltransferase n=1 Tax=Streptomyces sp. NPDC059567 TaxID=3346867 RepID=UPI0036974C78
MDSHPIADRYTVSPAETSQVDETAYAAVLHSDFRDHYADGRDLWTGEQAMREAPRVLSRALGDARDAHILDIGTGHGRDAEILLADGHRVTGIDLIASPQWETITARRPGRARFLVTPLTELPGRAEYRAVLDNGCLHHQHPDSYPRYLRRVRELLLPGGLFTVSVFQAAGEAGSLFVNAGKRLYREFTPDELNRLVTAQGFEPVEVRQVPRGTAGLTYLLGTFRRTADGDPR